MSTPSLPSTPQPDSSTSSAPTTSPPQLRHQHPPLPQSPIIIDVNPSKAKLRLHNLALFWPAVVTHSPASSRSRQSPMPTTRAQPPFNLSTKHSSRHLRRRLAPLKVGAPPLLAIQVCPPFLLYFGIQCQIRIQQGLLLRDRVQEVLIFWPSFILLM